VVVLPSLIFEVGFSFLFVNVFHVGENTQGSNFIILSFSPLLTLVLPSLNRNITCRGDSQGSMKYFNSRSPLSEPENLVACVFNFTCRGEFTG